MPFSQADSPTEPCHVRVEVLVYLLGTILRYNVDLFQTKFLFD